MEITVSRTARNRLEKRLQSRLDVLRREIAEGLQNAGGVDHVALAGDEGDESNADLISDTVLFDLQRDVSEIDAVRAALDRLAGGTYGLCIACGDQIEPERLEAEPAAARCIDCQLRQESARLRPRRHEY